MTADSDTRQTTDHPETPPWPFAHVVVTGGAGFVGSHVCEELVRRGSSVVCVDDLSTGSEENVAHLLAEPRFTLLVSDVSRGLGDPPELFLRTDLVLHLASPASPVDYRRRPIETLDVGAAGTRHALELSEATGARFVLASTSEVYGDPQVHPQPETYWGHVNPIGPRSVYDEAKRFAEAQTSAWRRTRGVDAGIVRIFNTYGPRMRTDDGRMVPTFIRQALGGEPLSVSGDGTQTRSVCYVGDLVEGLLAFAASGLPGPVNLGDDVELTVLQVAQDVIDVVGGPAPGIVHAELPEDDPRRRRPDVTLARRSLGWQAGTAWRDGLEETVAWYRARAGRPADEPVVIG